MKRGTCAQVGPACLNPAGYQTGGRVIEFAGRTQYRCGFCDEHVCANCRVPVTRYDGRMVQVCRGHSASDLGTGFREGTA